MKTKKLIAIFTVMAISMFAVITANAEVTKVQDLSRGYALWRPFEEQN